MIDDCLWAGRSLISVEMTRPPQAATKSLAEGMALEIVRRVLVCCVDAPNSECEHACYIEAETLDLAPVRAHGLHPTWRPS